MWKSFFKWKRLSGSIVTASLLEDTLVRPKASKLDVDAPAWTESYAVAANQMLTRNPTLSSVLITGPYRRTSVFQPIYLKSGTRK